MCSSDLYLVTPFDNTGAYRWFVVTMGTGVLATLLHQLPYSGTWLRVIAIILFVINLVFFTVMFTLISVRFLSYPDERRATLAHNVQAFFLAAVPMGFATIINMAVYVCVPIWKPGMIYVCWALWWLDVTLSAAAACFWSLRCQSTLKFS